MSACRVGVDAMVGVPVRYATLGSGDDFLGVPGFVRKQIICRSDGKEAVGAYMWESQAAAIAWPENGMRGGFRVGGHPFPPTLVRFAAQALKGEGE